MTCYLLDTDTLIDFSKGREPVVSYITQWIANGDTLGICPINITEFYSGLPYSQRKNWDEFFESLVYWSISIQAARNAGITRYECQKSGKILTTSDAIIAEVAQEQHAIIVTSNSKDYPLAKSKIFSPRA